MSYIDLLGSIPTTQLLINLLNPQVAQYAPFTIERAIMKVLNNTGSRVVNDNDIRMVMDHILSPAGIRVLDEIRDQPEHLRITLRIPEPGGHLILTLPVGAIRRIADYVLESLVREERQPSRHLYDSLSASVELDDCRSEPKNQIVEEPRRDLPQLCGNTRQVEVEPLGISALFGRVASRIVPTIRFGAFR